MWPQIFDLLKFKALIIPVTEEPESKTLRRPDKPAAAGEPPSPRRSNAAALNILEAEHRRNAHQGPARRGGRSEPRLPDFTAALHGRQQHWLRKGSGPGTSPQHLPPRSQFCSTLSPKSGTYRQDGYPSISGTTPKNPTARS